MGYMGWDGIGCNEARWDGMEQRHGMKWDGMGGYRLVEAVTTVLAA